MFVAGGDSELSFSFGQKARIDAQDAELAALRAELDQDRSQLATQQATIARLQDQLSQQAQQLDKTPLPSANLQSSEQTPPST